MTPSETAWFPATLPVVMQDQFWICTWKWSLKLLSTHGCLVYPLIRILLMRHLVVIVSHCYPLVLRRLKSMLTWCGTTCRSSRYVGEATTSNAVPHFDKKVVRVVNVKSLIRIHFLHSAQPRRPDPKNTEVRPKHDNARSVKPWIPKKVVRLHAWNPDAANTFQVWNHVIFMSPWAVHSSSWFSMVTPSWRYAGYFFVFCERNAKSFWITAHFDCMFSVSLVHIFNLECCKLSRKWCMMFLYWERSLTVANWVLWKI